MIGIAPCKLFIFSQVPTMKSLHAGPTPANKLVQYNSTFLKRKGGLFKKAHELSVLCSVDVAVFIFGQNKKLYEYSSCDMRDLITRYTYVRSRLSSERVVESRD